MARVFKFLCFDTTNDLDARNVQFLHGTQFGAAANRKYLAGKHFEQSARCPCVSLLDFPFIAPVAEQSARGLGAINVWEIGQMKRRNTGKPDEFYR